MLEQELPLALTRRMPASLVEVRIPSPFTHAPSEGPDLLPACLDGALHMWQAKSNFARPNMTIEGAHTKGTETGSVVFSVDGRTVLTRGGDDTVKRGYILSGGPSRF